MNILYLSSRFPYPPQSGDKIRTYNIIKHLSKKHSLSLISFALSPEDKHNIGKMQEYCKRVLTVDFSKIKAYINCMVYSSFSEPFQISYWHSSEMQRQIDKLAEMDSFDIIHVQFIRMAQYVTKYADKRKVLDSGDSFWLNLSRRSKLDRGLAWPLLKVEANKIRIYETEVAKGFDKITMVSPLDMECILDQDKNLPVSVIPMGVDIDYYQPDHNKYELSLLFTGTMSYFPNKDAALYFYNEIFPIIKKTVPDVKFYIVGNYPPRALTKLASNDDVFVTGHVEDVRPYFNKAAVFVCPLRSGSGMQAKILEAMAMGVPVVTTSIGITAVDAVPGRDILVADDNESFAREVIRLIKDNDFRSDISGNARKLVEENYRWDAIVDNFDRIYESLR